MKSEILKNICCVNYKYGWLLNVELVEIRHITVCSKSTESPAHLK